ncbi:MAG: bifunctional folylpolyglutamate synthase/dihydrofolate synthase, partial [Nitrospirae bacterium]|nr:bifunctional folylpolyglutamate synthase/dihydrofolate synthase [Nitrospirota bacterium]
VSFTERIRINNEQIAESEVVSLTEEIRSKISILNPGMPEPTFFEFVTAMAFLYFSRNNVDWAVLETGMGGRLDATNVINPSVSVITGISCDHKEFLGDTLKEIAMEKAGIIKEGIPVVSAMQKKEAEDVILKKAEEKSSDLYVFTKDFSGAIKSSTSDGITLDYHDEAQTIADIYTPLAGEHQLSNTCLAIKAAMVALENSNKLQVTSNESKSSKRYSLLKKGLAATRWQGRLEQVSDKPLIIVDGAHNPDAANALSEFIKKHFSNHRIILIMGIMSDKDITGIMRHLLPLASDIIFTAPAYGRAASPQKLAEYALSIGFKSKVAASVKNAIETATKISNESAVTSKEFKGNKNARNSLLVTRHSSLILITGSFYTIGEAKEVLG